jgi:hypothetical protein
MLMKFDTITMIVFIYGLCNPVNVKSRNGTESQEFEGPLGINAFAQTAPHYLP